MRLFKQLVYLILILVQVLNVTSAAALEKKLNIFIWSEYIDPAVVKEFERKFDCSVTLDLFEDNESMLAKIAAGGDAVYDVIFPSDYVLPSLKRRGLLKEFNQEAIPNLKNLEDKFRNYSQDPGNRFSAPYQWGTVGIYLRKKEGVTFDESWSLIFDPVKQPGPFVLIDSMREAFDAGLTYSGAKINSTDPKEIAAAEKLLKSAKERALGFDAGVAGKNKVLSRIANAAIVYSGDALKGMEEDPETYYFVPREGSEIWFDTMAIPAQAPHPELAHAFINYILDAKVGAQITNFNQYASPNAAAKPFIDRKILDNTSIYPSEAVLSRLTFLQDVGEATKLYDQAWTRVKGE